MTDRPKDEVQESDAALRIANAYCPFNREPGECPVCEQMANEIRALLAQAAHGPAACTAETCECYRAATEKAQVLIDSLRAALDGQPCNEDWRRNAFEAEKAAGVFMDQRDAAIQRAEKAEADLDSANSQARFNNELRQQQQMRAEKAEQATLSSEVGPCTVHADLTSGCVGCLYTRLRDERELADRLAEALVVIRDEALCDSPPETAWFAKVSIEALATYACCEADEGSGLCVGRILKGES